MHAAAVVRKLRTLMHAVISNDPGDPSRIIVKNLAVLDLCQAVFVRCAPRLHRHLIAEERQRQDFAGLSQALEAFNGDEAVDLLEDGAQLRRLWSGYTLSGMGRWFINSTQSCAT